MAFSMTGYGLGEGAVAGGRLQVEIRTVNHRFFNLSARLPGELVALEGQVREQLRQDFDRGHVSVSARWVEAPPREAGLMLNLDRARAAVAAQVAVGQGLAVADDHGERPRVCAAA